ncbi:MAG TPA: 3-carboxy-cis,cis-muconate cycloisomerase [Gaiellaceae bacterium]
MTFDGVFVPDELARAVSDDAWLEAMLDAERALARVEAEAGVIPADAAAAIEAACRADLYDIGALSDEGRTSGNPVVPLVRALREQVGDPGSRFVHWGATSQDIIDSAAMLVAQRALLLIVADLGRAAIACAALAREHRDTPMVARTLLQQAVPTTFGYKAAGWLSGILDARARLAALRLPAQLGGAAGTLAPFGDQGSALLRAYAEELGLAEPPVPWHTARAPIASLGSELALTASVCAKAALDVLLLAQTEVGEVAEAAGGASSTMPHKRNAIGAVLTVACARRTRAGAGLLLESVVQEHERAAGAWHAEWGALTDTLAATGGAAAALHRSLDGLEVDAGRMRANLDTHREDVLSERTALLGEPGEPEGYLGSAGVFVDRVLERFRAELGT